MFIYTEKDTESHKLKITAYNTKHTDNTQIHFQQSIFLKLHKLWAPRASWTAFELTIDLHTGKIRPMRLH